MTPLDWVALGCAVLAYVTYALATFGRVPWAVFDWANLVLGPPIVVAALAAGVPGAAFLPAAFCVTGGASIARRHLGGAPC